jgi:hypothetical protein
MKGKFLTKNTKITIREEKEPAGLKTAMKARKESGTFNTDELKDFEKKMSKYYEFDNEEEFVEPKVNRSDYEEAYEIEALGAGKMSALKYDNEDTEVFKSFMDRIDALNDTSEYDKEFGTKDGFGEGEKEDDTYEMLKTNSEKYKEHKYKMPDEYQDTPRVRVTKESKNDKMKRLNFKNEFENEFEMKKLIPEHYKNDGQVFLMDDGVQTFKVRWDEELNEGTVLSYKNKTMITEDTKIYLNQLKVRNYYNISLQLLN